MQDFFHPPYGPALQPYLDAVRMCRRVGEDVFDNALGEFAGALILLKYDGYALAWFDVAAFLSVHGRYFTILERRMRKSGATAVTRLYSPVGLRPLFCRICAGCQAIG